jgi:two-component system, OmpR family, phosphate regulon sensor histidine kinase PhoR
MAKTSSALDHEQLDSLINSMADGVISLDTNLKVRKYNGAALNILDENGRLAGRSISRVVRLIDKDNQPVDMTELIRATKTSVSMRDYTIMYEDGSKAALYLSIAPVRAGYGKSDSQGFVLLLRDITREKSLEDERDEFISVISHELRTPITIAEGSLSNAQYAAEKNHSDKTLREMIDTAHAQILFLANLINDLSTLSRAERGKLAVSVEPVNIHDLVCSLEKGYTKQAASKGLIIKTELDSNLETLRSSSLYVQEILQNFVTNAIKYTEKGSVTISATSEKRGARIAITDTGIGISKPDQERVFDKFFRSEDFRTRSNNGTGLGLYVTMKLARLLHAEISVTSELDHGSTFTIFFPHLD